QSGKIDDHAILPLSGLLILALTGLAALALAVKRSDNGHVAFLGNCAIVQAIPVVCLVILATVSAGQLSLIFAGYGLFPLFFAMLAASAALVAPTLPPLQAET